MRLLTRRIGQSFVIGDAVTVTVKPSRQSGQVVRSGSAGLLVSRAEIIEELSVAAAQAVAAVGGVQEPGAAAAL